MAKWSDSSDKSVPDAKVGKSVGIVTMCNKREGNLCYALSCIPEKVSCPCTYFACSDKDAIKKFNDLCAEYKCKGKIKIKGKITYFDLLKLDEYRGGGS